MYSNERMTDLCRIGVAISGDLLAKFDKLIAQRGYTNRSEAFRDLIRNELVQETWKSSDSWSTTTTHACCPKSSPSCSITTMPPCFPRCTFTWITTTVSK